MRIHQNYKTSCKPIIRSVIVLLILNCSQILSSICGKVMATNNLYQFQVEVVFSIPISISCCILIQNFNFMLYFNSNFNFMLYFQFQFQFHVVFSIPISISSYLFNSNCNIINNDYKLKNNSNIINND